MVSKTLAAAEAEVAATLATLDDAVMAAPFPAPPKGVEVTTQRWLIHLVSHAHDQLGAILSYGEVAVENVLRDRENARDLRLIRSRRRAREDRGELVSIGNGAIEPGNRLRSAQPAIVHRREGLTGRR